MNEGGNVALLTDIIVAHVDVRVHLKEERFHGVECIGESGGDGHVGCVVFHASKIQEMPDPGSSR